MSVATSPCETECLTRKELRTLALMAVTSRLSEVAHRLDAFDEAADRRLTTILAEARVLAAEVGVAVGEATIGRKGQQ